MRYKDQATSIFSEIADIIESSDNAENNIYDIVDFMIGIMTKDQLQIIQASLQLSLKYADSQYIENVDEIMQEIENNTRLGK